MEKQLSNKVILMTGATSGLGKAAALELLENDATLIVLYRNKDKFLQLEKENGSIGEIVGLHCDLSSFSSLKMALDEVRKSYDQLDIIINNAGVWSFDFSETADGIEKTFQVNVLAPYIIMQYLKDLLFKDKDASKVITTASGLHQGTIQFDDIEYRNKYSGYKAYRQSKLGVILLTRLLGEREDDIVYVTQHPGLVSTGLARGGNWFARLFFKLFGKSLEKGAETLVYLVKTPADKLKSGEYYADKKVKKTDTSVSRNIDVARKLESEIKEMIRENSSFDL
ncbi:MAG: SDR family NAD(P)-dependent oxidoreductase [Brumimicrobium sp.]|nr:SDR family NAD(P)-dependent oxidoreductase [Brumimicrobium sp.]